MDRTRLSSKGQVVLPKAVREAHGWAPGTEFTVELTADGIRLRPTAPFAPTALDEVAGSVRHEGPTKSLEDMDDAIAAAVSQRARRSRRG